MTIKQTLMATAVAGALSAAPGAFAAIGALFDQTGSGGAGEGITELTFAKGNALYQSLFPAAQTGIGSIWGQSLVSGIVGLSSYDMASRAFTYQFYIPVDSAVDAVDTNKINLTNDLARTGYFKIFVDTAINTGIGDSKFDPLTGTGYGSNTDASGTPNWDVAAVGHNGLKEILSGEVRVTSPTNLTQDPTQISYLGNTNGKDQLSFGIGGKLSADVTVMSQDSAFWRSDMIGTLLDVDIQLGSLGPQAPFDTTVAVSDKVVNQTPDFGNHPVTLVINYETQKGTGDIGKTKTLPLNDFGCNAAKGDPTNLCDMQVQITGAATLLTEYAPEPGSLALLGLGLAGLGMATRARRRSRG